MHVLFVVHIYALNRFYRVYITLQKDAFLMYVHIQKSSCLTAKKQHKSLVEVDNLSDNNVTLMENC